VSTADHAFRDIAAVNGDPVPTLQFNANAGLSLARFGSVGLAYVQVRRDSAVVTNPLPGGLAVLLPPQDARVLSISYSTQFRGVSFFATAFHDFARQGSNGILIGLTFPLGERDSVGVSTGSGTGGTFEQVQAQQSAASVGDWGYQAYGATGKSPHQFAQVQYKAPWALLTAGVDHLGPQTSLALQTQGSLSFVDGALFASNTIADSFAVVDTNGLAGVRVLHENREAGRTNASGKLLVPDLRSFDINRLAIDPDDVPPDSTIDVITREVRPQDRSGVVVRFPVKVSRGALLQLVDEAGVPLPVSSTATLQATGTTVPVGYDGNAYVQDLSAHNEVVVELADGRRCSVTFDYGPVPGRIPTIGPLSCRQSIQ
jgi:outer membrane usher protein